ncbi:MAG: hypothetical protein VR70_14525 [Rhodospirillaceae bacterium BRH_c57]|nr:MAG: hypothetical protein VR70_15400 [Rhodospirillaceae bacterium BRH_c57]KJS36095.1 MAG: hypothetical protein VR70_14525 [Rhodospirillaceae bacterium BRH_c57]
MSMECSLCEQDARAGHDETCPHYKRPIIRHDDVVPTPADIASQIMRLEAADEVHREAQIVNILAEWATDVAVKAIADGLDHDHDHDA